MRIARSSRVGIWLAVTLLSSLASAQQFSAPLLLNANPSNDGDTDDGGVHVACGANATCVATWRNDKLDRFLVARSVDEGRTWFAPHVLHSDPHTTGQGVEIATDGLGHWVAVWQFGPGCQGCDDVWTSHSDDGDTWSQPISLGLPGGDDVFPSVATDGSGAFVAVWEFVFNSLQSPRTGMRARSTDGGATWDVVSQWPPADGPSNIRIAAGGGTLIALWGYGSTYYARSTDGGLTWTPRLVLDDSHGGNALATDRHGTWVVALTTSRQIPDPDSYYGESESDFLFVRSEDDGLTWSAPTWLNTNAESDRRNDDSYVRLAANEHGVWAAVWQGYLGPRSGGADGDLLLAWSHDGGRTWGPPQALNRTAIGDPAWDGSPHVTDAPSGGFVAVWDGWGLYGNDFDAFTARVSCGCAPCDVCAEDGACVAAPRGDCATLGPTDSAKLSISDSSGSAKDEIAWKLILGAQQPVPDLDDPRADGTVALCMYAGDGARLFRGTAEAGLACGRDTCWSKRGKSFAYARSDGAPDGIVRAASRAGSDGRARLTIVGQGKKLQVPALPLSPPVVTQLQVAGGQCWQADFPAESLTVNRPRRVVGATAGNAP